MLGSFSYGYDGVTARLASVTYPNGQTSAYRYLDNANDHRLQTIHHHYPDGTTLSKFDYTYDAAGNIVTWRQQADATAVDWAYGYDAADQLTRAVKTADADGALLQRFAYAYDPAGNRLSEQIDDAVTTRSYDALNRLVEQHGGGSVVVKGQVNEPATVTINGAPATVQLDGTFQGTATLTGATTTVNVVATDAGGNATTAVYEMDQAAASRTFTFDANGNLTSDGSRTFEWDARNQLVAVNVGTHRSEFAYDGKQRRVRIIEKENTIVQSDAKVIWCRTTICEERAADGLTVMRRPFWQGEQVAGTLQLYVGDANGSLDVVTDPGGVPLVRYSFDPWGRRTMTGTSDVTDVGYAGQRWHSATALSLALYRAYDTDVGRWTAEDPAGRVDGPNLFLYGRNNPVRLNDPLGLCSCSDPCPSGEWKLDTATATAGSIGLAFAFGVGRLRCSGKPTVGRMANVYCAVWGAVFTAGIDFSVQIKGAAVTGVCRPEDLHEFHTSDTVVSYPIGSAGQDSFGWGPSIGVGIGRADCRVVPW